MFFFFFFYSLIFTSTITSCHWLLGIDLHPTVLNEECAMDHVILCSKKNKQDSLIFKAMASVNDEQQAIAYHVVKEGSINANVVGSVSCDTLRFSFIFHSCLI